MVVPFEVVSRLVVKTRLRPQYSARGPQAEPIVRLRGVRKGYPAIVKLSRTTLEIGFSLPVTMAGAVPLTA
jgi:hypothetical protein